MHYQPRYRRTRAPSPLALAAAVASACAPEASPFDVAIVVEPDLISVDGLPAVSLDDASAPPTEDTRGPLILPLFRVLLERSDDSREASPHRHFQPRAQLRVDEAVPWTTVRSVLYTTGQSGLQPTFVVRAPTGDVRVAVDLGPFLPYRPTRGRGLDPPALHLAIAVSDQGYWVRGNDAELGPDGGIRLRCASPCGTADQASVAELTRLLRRLKQRWPSEITLTVMPGDAAHWGAVSRTIEAARGEGSAEGFPRVTIQGT